MPFNQKPQKFNAKINTVTVGTGDKAVTIGGNCMDSVINTLKFELEL